MPKYSSDQLLPGKFKWPSKIIESSLKSRRGKPELPAQIGGIVGAYLLSVLLVCVVIFILARRIRRRNQLLSDSPFIETQNSYCLDNTIVNSALQPSAGISLESSQIPPVKDGGTPSLTSPSHRLPEVHTKNQAFDFQVIEADREKMSRNLAEFYVHVMAHEEAKATSASLSSIPLSYSHHEASIPTPKHESQIKLDSHDEIEIPPKARKTLKVKSMIKTIQKMSSIPSRLKHLKVKTKSAHKVQSLLPTVQTPNIIVAEHRDESNRSLAYHSHNSLTRPPLITTKDDRYKSPDSSFTRESSSHVSNILNLSTSSRDNLTSSTGSKTPFFSFSPQMQASDPRSTQLSGPSLPLRKFDGNFPSLSLTPLITKTTILERTRRGDDLGTTNQRTPYSAESTPYSPYQPFSMTIPVTPTLITKEERKRRKKLTPKTPVRELVKSDADLWDSAYI